MTIREALHHGFQRLKVEGCDTPFLDAVVLLSDVLCIPKETLFASYPERIDDSDYSRFLHHLESRFQGNPVSYIRRKKEFFGLEFYVDSRVLIPRPDTETIVEAALDLIDRNPSIRTIHDVGTGSGCIAIALKKNRPHLYITASDISEKALEVFRLNARTILRNEIPHMQSDLLQNVPGTFDMIVSNPPYLTEQEIEVLRGKKWPEPESALFGGSEGLDIIKRLIPECAASLADDGYLLIEGGSLQAKVIRKLMETSGFSDIMITCDLAGRERVVAGRKP